MVTKWFDKPSTKKDPNNNDSEGVETKGRSATKLTRITEIRTKHQ